MKISKKRLRYLIKEELENVLGPHEVDVEVPEQSMGGLTGEEAFGAGYEIGQQERENFNFTGDVADLDPAMAMELGQDAGMMGLGDEVDSSGDDEIGMTVNQLQAIATSAMELSMLVQDLEYVPEWGQGKVATVLDRLDSLRSYLVGKSVGQ